MTRRISSCLTFVHTVIGVGLAVLFIAVTAYVGLDAGPLTLICLIFSILAIHQAWLAIGLKKIEVDGKYLIVSNFVKSARVHVSEIDRIRENPLLSPYCIWIHFRTSTVFGRKVVFTPVIGWAAPWRIFRSHPVVIELRELKEKYEEDCQRVN